MAGDFGVEEWVVTDMNQRMREVKQFNTQLNSRGLTTIYDVGYLNGPYEPVKQLHDKGELTARVFYPLRYYIRTPEEVPATVSLILREKPLARNHWFGVLGIGEHV